VRVQDTAGGFAEQDIVATVIAFNGSLSQRAFNAKLTGPLTTRKNANTAQWQALASDAALKIGSPGAYPGIFWHQVALWAYLANDSAGKTAVRNAIVALATANPPSLINVGSNYNANYGNDFQHKEIWLWAWEYCWTVDLCYDAFSEADRSLIATAFNGYLDQWAKADRDNWAFLYTTASPNNIANPFHLANNYMQNAFLAHAMCAGASAGWNPRADEWLAKAEQMRAAWSTNLNETIYPAGIETEGDYYAKYVRHGIIAQYLLAEKAANPSQFSLTQLAKQLELSMFSIRPNYHALHVGAQAADTKFYHSNKIIENYTLLSLLEEKQPGNALVGQMKTLADAIESNAQNASSFGGPTGKGFLRFFWGKAHITGTSMTARTLKYWSGAVSNVRGMNKIFLRSNWDDAATDIVAVMFGANSNATPPYSHANPDAPGFQWHRGADQIALDPEYFTNNGTGAEGGDGTAGVTINNCVVPSAWFAGDRRYNNGGDSAAPTIEQESTGASPIVYRYARINATAYYDGTGYGGSGGAARNCAFLKRSYLWLGDDFRTVLIWDRVQTTGQSKYWQLHTAGNASVSGSLGSQEATWTVGGTNARLRQLYVDSATAITSTDLGGGQFSIAGSNYQAGPGPWRIRFESPANDSRFLTILDLQNACTAAAINGSTSSGYLEAVVTVNGITMTIRINDSGELVSIT
jgi:hypothetical protein